jgi:MoaA/NifB/PqqE/SkfB family radical SAM enzyme
LNKNLSLTSCLENLRDQYDVVAEIDCNDLLPGMLIEQVKSAYKESYQDNERIVIHYTKGNQYTQQSIQTVLNVVDISNFFVIVLTSDIKHEIVSTDDVPLTLVHTLDDFIYTDLYSRAISKEDIIRSSDLILTDNTKHFCMAPWVHLFVSTSGDARLCCAATKKLGTTVNSSINELFNNKHINQIREDLIHDLPIEGCEKCYNEEALGRSSYRIAYNQRYAKDYWRVKGDSPALLRWDFRFNNLCNLSCRSCGPYASTAWYKPAKSIGIDVKQFVANDTKTYNELLEHIDVVEEVYFAGGEPLIMPEHYELLDRLISLGKTNVKLVYNTNLTELTFKGTSVLELWNQFNDVAVCGSLDASAARGEYLRCGSAWDKIESNRHLMKEQCPNVYFWISATTGMINALHVPDFHQDWVKKELIKAEDFNIQNIYSPEYMRVDRATPDLKELIINRYNSHLEWLKPLDSFGRATQGYQSVINYLENLKGFDKNLFWSNIQPLDEYYGVNLLDVFPELDILPKP